MKYEEAIKSLLNEVAPLGNP